jgi:hypothetical protein
VAFTPQQMTEILDVTFEAAVRKTKERDPTCCRQSWLASGVALVKMRMKEEGGFGPSFFFFGDSDGRHDDRRALRVVVHDYPTS